MAKTISTLTSFSSNFHPDMSDNEYINEVKKEMEYYHSHDLNEFKIMCETMSSVEIEKKIYDLKKVLKIVEECLNIYRYKRDSQQISNALRDTVFMRCLLIDQISFAEQFKKNF